LSGELDSYTSEEAETKRIYEAAKNEVNRWKDIKFFIDFVCSKIVVEYSELTNQNMMPREEYYKAFQDFCKENHKTGLYDGAQLHELSDLLNSSSFKQGTTANPKEKPKVVDLIRQALLVEHPVYPESKQKINSFKEKLFGDKQIGGRKRRQMTKRRRSNRRRRTRHRK
jgi:hypothetical protein